MTGFYEGDVSGTVTTDADGRASLSGLPAGSRIVLRFDVEGVTFERAYTAVAGVAEPWSVDFANCAALSWETEESADGAVTGKLVIANAGTQLIAPVLTLLCDGAELSYEASAISLAAGESVAVPFALTRGERAKPYLVYACVQTAYSSQVSVLGE